MRALGALLRFYSLFFHMLLSLTLLGVGIVFGIKGLALPQGIFPFGERHLIAGVFGMGLLGFIITALAVSRILKILFPLWATTVAYFMVRAIILERYPFANFEDFVYALWVIFASLLALIGAWWTLKARRGRLYR